MEGGCSFSGLNPIILEARQTKFLKDKKKKKEVSK